MPALLRLWEQFDEVIDAEDGDGSLGGKLEALCLNHGWFVHTSLTVISGFAIHQIQTNPTGQQSKSLPTNKNAVKLETSHFNTISKK